MHWAVRFRLWLTLCLAFAVALIAPSAVADPAGLPAVISVGGSGLDPAAIQSAVERELGVALSIDPSAPERLEIALTGRRANVTYYARGREPVTRSVDLPRDDARALATIAFLAGNLARDEASELLRQLAPPATGSEPDEVPRPPPPPPPAPEAKPAAPAKPAAKPAAKPSEPTLIEPDPVAVNASLWHPVTVLKQTERRRLNFELGLAYSRVGAIRGAGMTLGYLRVDGPVEGYSYAMAWNRSGEVTGLQMANLVNEGYGTLRGVSYADLVNVRQGDIFGLQLAGIFVRGADVTGVQAAGIMSLARDVRGVEAAGVVALAEDVTGIHAAGVVAVARDVQGVQASMVNVARRVNGLQVGLVNVADEIHGGAIGLVSIAKNGRLQPVLYLPGPGAPLSIGIKSVTDLTYTELAAGYDPWRDRYRQDESLGLHLELGHRLFAETGIGYDETHEVKGNKLVRQEVRLDARVGFEPVHGLTPFVGGSLTRRIGGRGADYRGEYCFGLAAF